MLNNIFLALIFTIVGWFIGNYISLKKSNRLSEFFFPEEHVRNFSLEKIIGYALTGIAMVITVVTAFLPNSISIDFRIFAISFLIFSVAVALRLDVFYREYNELASSLKSETKDLIHSYKQLSDYEVRNKYNDFFADFTRYNLPVLAIQSYNYYQLPNSSLSKIKIEYEHGYVQENVDINTLYQSYHFYNHSLLKKLEKGIRYLKNENKGDGLVDFIFDLTESKDSPLSADESALLFLANEILEQAASKGPIEFDSLIKGFTFKNMPFESHNLKKRVGLFQSIIHSHILSLGKMYKFYYNGTDDDKGQRIYVSIRAVAKKGKRKVFLIVLDSSVMGNNYNTEIEDIVLNFEELLESNSLKEVGD